MVFIHQSVSSDNLFSSLMWYHTYKKFLHSGSTAVNRSAKNRSSGTTDITQTAYGNLPEKCIVRIIFICEYYFNDFYAKYKINLLETNSTVLVACGV